MSAQATVPKGFPFGIPDPLCSKIRYLAELRHLQTDDKTITKESLYGRVLRLTHTIVCAIGALNSFGFSAKAQGADIHPEIGRKAPAELLNSELLALPAQERQAWIYGVLIGMSVVSVQIEPATSRCLTDWAFDVGNGLEVISGYVAEYPGEPAYAVIYAVAQQACHGL